MPTLPIHGVAHLGMLSYSVCMSDVLSTTGGQQGNEQGASDNSAEETVRDEPAGAGAQHLPGIASQILHVG